MSFCKVAGSFSRCIAGTMRILLAVTALFLALVSSAILYGGLGVQAGTFLAGVSGTDTSTTIVVCLATYQICLALLGIHGAVFRSQDSLKLFALLAGLNVILVIHLAFFVSPKLDEASRQIVSKLDRSQSKFDWTAEPASNSTSEDSEVRDATYIWNRIQSNFHCCGLQAFDDWDKQAYDDATHSLTRVFPSSCCPPGHMARRDGLYLCPESGGVYRTPCVRMIQGLSNMTTELTYGLVLLNLLVFLMANVVIHGGPKVDEELAKLEFLSI